MKYRNINLRHELKYFINNYEYIYLRSRLKEIIYRDKNTVSKEGYHVRSAYFDDVYDSAYHEKEDGVGRRKKYRIRIYNKSDSFIRLEKKEKYGQYISKQSARLSKDHFYRILNDDINFMIRSKNALGHQFYCESKTKLLKPKVIVDYEREAYFLNEGNVRITFDKKLQAGFNSFDIFSDDVILVNAFEPAKMILEIKYDDYLPGYIKNILQISSHENSAISKYVICRRIQNTNQRKETIWGN